MSPPSLTPVIIGVGDFINRSKRVEDAVEPLQLMLHAIEGAMADTGISESSSQDLRAAVDSLDVVRTWTWPYDDLPGLIAQQLGINPSRKHYTDNGGNQPGLWFDEAARRVSKGETKVAILTGGEALASCKCAWHLDFSLPSLQSLQFVLQSSQSANTPMLQYPHVQQPSNFLHPAGHRQESL